MMKKILSRMLYISSGADMLSVFKNNKGESLAETLIASLIIGLAMIMLLTISQVSSGLSSKATEEYSNYYDKLNLYELLELESLNNNGDLNSTVVTASLYDDGYLLGSESVVLYEDSRIVNGNEITFNYVDSGVS